MSELDDFLTETLARQIEAEEALHNGDVTPRMQMWSTQDPVTVFGAAKSTSACASPTSTAARTGSGRSFTATPTAPRSSRARPQWHRRRSPNILHTPSICQKIAIRRGTGGRSLSSGPHFHAPEGASPGVQASWLD